jgi:hypothetical protein
LEYQNKLFASLMLQHFLSQYDVRKYLKLLFGVVFGVVWCGVV